MIRFFCPAARQHSLCPQSVTQWPVHPSMPHTCHVRTLLAHDYIRFSSSFVRSLIFSGFGFGALFSRFFSSTLSLECFKITFPCRNCTCGTRACALSGALAHHKVCHSICVTHCVKLFWGFMRWQPFFMPCPESSRGWRLL